VLFQLQFHSDNVSEQLSIQWLGIALQCASSEQFIEITLQGICRHTIDAGVWLCCMHSFDRADKLWQ
jgi:hypothetical protein